MRPLQSAPSRRASRGSVEPSTYRVMGAADGRLIYESHSLSAVETVVEKFAEGAVKVLAPGETA